MASEGFFKTACEHCGGRIEVPVDAAGLSVQCPHCSRQTVVRQPRASEMEVPQKSPAAWLWIGLSVAVIAVGAIFFLRTFVVVTVTPSKTAAQATNVAIATNVTVPTKSEPKPKSPEDFKISNVRLETPKGSGLRYALGTVKNDSEHQRFGIQIELALFDKNGQALPGKATDYVQMIEPGKEWKFRALVLDAKAASVKVASIKEQE